MRPVTALLFLLLSLFALPFSARTARAERPPNLVFILADDLGYGDLGCYGQRLIKTPHLDRLAREGMRFTQAYAGATVCAPSRCVLMTGRHSGHAHVRGNREIKPEGQEPLPEGTVTVAHVLKRAGYTTGAFGKWGLGFPGSTGEPNRQGFDQFYGYNCQRQAHNYYPPHLWRNTEKVLLPENAEGREQTYSHDLIAEEALKFVRGNKDRPFFLYVPFTISHTRFQVPDLGEYADRPWEPNHKIQAAMISRMDRDVGRLMSLLKELKLDGETLVIFASDNGPHGDSGTLAKFRAAGPLRGRKRDLYEGGIRVPFIARWPGKIRAGATSDLITSFQDLLPTFAKLAKTPTPEGLDGISIAPTLLGRGGQRQHPHLYWEFYEQGGKQAARMGDWKGIRLNVGREPRGPIELYNLKTDLGGTRNIAQEHPQVVKQIVEIMDREHVPSPLWNFPPARPGARGQKKGKA